MVYFFFLYTFWPNNFYFQKQEYPTSPKNKMAIPFDEIVYNIQGRIQDFKLGGAHLKKLRRTGGGAKIFGVFRVKKITILRQQIIFFPILGGGGGAGCAPPPWYHNPNRQNFVMTVRHTVVDKGMAEVVTDIKILKKRKEIQS